MDAKRPLRTESFYDQKMASPWSHAHSNMVNHEGWCTFYCIKAGTVTQWPTWTTDPYLMEPDGTIALWLGWSGIQVSFSTLQSIPEMHGQRWSSSRTWAIQVIWGSLLWVDCAPSQPIISIFSASLGIELFMASGSELDCCSSLLYNTNHCIMDTYITMQSAARIRVEGLSHDIQPWSQPYNRLHFKQCLVREGFQNGCQLSEMLQMRLACAEWSPI